MSLHSACFQLKPKTLKLNQRVTGLVIWVTLQYFTYFLSINSLIYFDILLWISLFIYFIYVFTCWWTPSELLDIVPVKPKMMGLMRFCKKWNFLHCWKKVAEAYLNYYFWYAQVMLSIHYERACLYNQPSEIFQ